MERAVARSCPGGGPAPGPPTCFAAGAFLGTPLPAKQRLLALHLPGNSVIIRSERRKLAGFAGSDRGPRRRICERALCEPTRVGSMTARTPCEGWPGQASRRSGAATISPTSARDLRTTGRSLADSPPMPPPVSWMERTGLLFRPSRGVHQVLRELVEGLGVVGRTPHSGSGAATRSSGRFRLALSP
jgi:hypothetical protein